MVRLSIPNGSRSNSSRENVIDIVRFAPVQPSYEERHRAHAIMPLGTGCCNNTSNSAPATLLLQHHTRHVVSSNTSHSVVFLHFHYGLSRPQSEKSDIGTERMLILWKEGKVRKEKRSIWMKTHYFFVLDPLMCNWNRDTDPFSLRGSI